MEMLKLLLFFLDRLPVQDGKGTSDGYNSILFHPDTSSTTTSYNLVYRPPNLNDRLSPGEPRPRFWVNPFSHFRSPAIVSVAWGNWPVSYYQYVSHQRNSNSQSNNNKQIVRDPGFSEINGTKKTIDSGDNNLMVQTYPDFILPYINKVIRLRLVCLDPKVSQLVGSYCHLKHGVHTEPSAELSYLIRNVHSLRLYMTYSRVVNGLPEISVEEHHGGIKRLRKIRYRQMPVCWIDMDHRKPAIKVVGESFLLSLEPPSSKLSTDDFPDGNGELPSATGLYVRNLDTCADTKIHFSTRLYHWYSQSAEDTRHRDQANSNVAHSSGFHDE